MNTSRASSASILLMLLCACSAGREANPHTDPTHTDSERPPQSASRGLIIPPEGGERFDYCARPLTLTVKVDSQTARTTRLVAGTAELRGDEGIGRHRDVDEVIYIRHGWGYAVFGADTTHLGPGSVLYVPPGTPHRLIRTGSAPMEYFWVLGPRSSASGFREAATLGCPGRAAAPSPPDAQVSSDVQPPLVLAPGVGERITYCPFPLTITFKVDAESAAESRLVAAAGALRQGSEAGVHSVDEVVLITHGRGRAFAGADTAAVEPGSIMYTPAGERHGFINENSEPLEYLVVYGPWDSPRSRGGFRRLASQPGPWCPDTFE